MDSILGHPTSAFVVSLIAIALTLSGRFNVNAARVVLVVAWVVGIVGLYDTSLAEPAAWKFALETVGFTISLFLLILWARSEIVPQYVGTLTSRRVLFSPIQDRDRPTIEIGDSGVIIIWNDPLGQMIAPLLKGAFFTIETNRGAVQISTVIFDKTGRRVAELIRNKWQVAPPPGTWDRNYSKDALEVKDSRGRIVLQVKVLPDRIQIQGEWWNDGKGLRIAKNTTPDADQTGAAIITGLGPDYDPNEPHIEPMFHYPSAHHLGEKIRV